MRLPSCCDNNAFINRLIAQLCTNDADENWGLAIDFLSLPLPPTTHHDEGTSFIFIIILLFLNGEQYLDALLYSQIVAALL